jgi:hypothetical protein
LLQNSFCPEAKEDEGERVKEDGRRNDPNNVCICE